MYVVKIKLWDDVRKAHINADSEEAARDRAKEIYPNHEIISVVPRCIFCHPGPYNTEDNLWVILGKGSGDILTMKVFRCPDRAKQYVLERINPSVQFVDSKDGLGGVSWVYIIEDDGISREPVEFGYPDGIEDSQIIGYIMTMCRE